jgi:pyruvate dehydrogenase E2 component (dihydrolipoamide acetyltransferase)
MPKLGQSEEVGKIVRWLKREGDVVTLGEVLFEIETDKALLEVESFAAGTLLKIVVPEGATVPVQSTVAFVGEPGEPVPEVTVPPSLPKQADLAPRASAAPSQAAPPGAVSKPRQGRASAGKEETRSREVLPTVTRVEESHLFKISPRAAKLAKDSALDPTSIAGTGPGGRLVERDVRTYLESKGYGRLRITPAAKGLAVTEGIDILSLAPKGDTGRLTVADIETVIAERPQPMTRMRQVIAERLTESYQQAPHFFVTVSSDVTELESLRSELKAQGTSYTITDFLLKATALALEKFPTVNSTTDGESIRWHSRIDLGFAVALEHGLVVPVIRDAQELSLAEIHTRAKDLTAKARAGQLTPAEMTGSTFTISNLGMMDVENFTAIINPGESAILAVSTVIAQPVVKNGQIAIRSIMKMTLSSDHRIIDGALAARFVNAIRKTLEEISLWRRSI